MPGCGDVNETDDIEGIQGVPERTLRVPKRNHNELGRNRRLSNGPS